MKNLKERAEKASGGMMVVEAEEVLELLDDNATLMGDLQRTLYLIRKWGHAIFADGMSVCLEGSPDDIGRMKDFNVHWPDGHSNVVDIASGVLTDLTGDPDSPDAPRVMPRPDVLLVENAELRSNVGHMEMELKLEKEWQERMKEEIAELRATNTRLNRRATRAEAAAKVTIEDCRRQGVSVGRMLANNGIGAVLVERDALKAENSELRAALARMQAVFTPDRPWPALSCLRVLANAAEVLLDVYNFDGLGHEEVRAAIEGARAAMKHADQLDGVK